MDNLAVPLAPPQTFIFKKELHRLGQHDRTIPCISPRVVPSCAVTIAESEELKGKIILNVLNEPIPGEEGDKSLLHYVVDEPNNSLLATVVRKVVASFK